MTNHTPGPWKRAGRWGNIHSAISDPTGGQLIASVWTHKQKALGRRAKGPEDYEETPEGMANYRLMLAAPELLEAAQAVMEFYDNGTPLHASSLIIADLREAIAKAKGGEA